MAEASDRKKNNPTEKMLAAADAAAKRLGIELPKGLKQDFEVCKKFLDENLHKPSPKALDFAKKIAKEKGLVIPDEAMGNGKSLSAWIDDNK